MIDFEHVSKEYKKGGKLALEDVNFHVDDGEFVFLLGHSGAGKSTLLKLILREEVPSEGKVLVDGRDVARMRRRQIPYLRRQMGIIFQDFRLIPSMTVYENIAFAMHVTNIGRKQIKERVGYMLSWCIWRIRPMSTRSSSPAVSSSVWPWPAPWPTPPSWSLRTSPLATSTPS